MVDEMSPTYSFASVRCKKNGNVWHMECCEQNMSGVFGIVEKCRETEYERKKKYLRGMKID